MMSSPKYVGSYTSDGLLNIVYQVHEIIGDVYVLEAISYFDLITLIASGSEPSDEPSVESSIEPSEETSGQSNTTYTPENSIKPDSDTVKTGDTSSMPVILAVFAASLASGLLLVKRRRRNQD